MYRRLQRGLALIEALVALAVMGIGMLGIVGIQTTLRQNADTAKQRSEAIRIAQEEIERWRAYTSLPAGAAGTVTYGNLDTGTEADVTGSNVTYTLRRTVWESLAPQYKVLRVDVSWTDRNAQTQAVQLNTALAALEPQLAGTLGLPADGTPTRMTNGRARNIPILAKDLGNGTSGFIPPQPAATSLTTWVFNNNTGLVTVCLSTATATSLLTLTNITGCGTAVGQLLSGVVRFGYNTTPTAAVAEFPTATALNLDINVAVDSVGNPTPAFQCYDDSPSTSVVASTMTAVRYYCVVYPNSDGKWSGTSTLVPLGLDGGPAWTLTTYKVCRYTPATSDSPTPPTPNEQHPRRYVDVVASQRLVNQNFLVIAGSASCPTDVAADPANGDFVNSNTLQHQP